MLNIYQYTILEQFKKRFLVPGIGIIRIIRKYTNRYECYYDAIL